LLLFNNRNAVWQAKKRMKLQFDFVAHPGHLIRGDFNLCVLGCVPAMVTGDATTAANDFVWTFGCSFSGDDAAVEGAALRAFHEKWEKDGTGLRMQSLTKE
jgi:hypothetical protein